MTPVRLDPLRKAIADGDPRAAAAVDFVDAQLNSSGLRPSIETSVHAIIPAPVVVHIHCVNTIALAVRRDGEALVRERLRPCGCRVRVRPISQAGLAARPGNCGRLTKNTNVFVLANHGLVVAGETVAEVADRIERVCEALSAPARPAPQADIEKLASIVEGTDYRLPHDPAAHAVALDPKSLAIAGRGSLYPDHVVFLGPGLVRLRRRRPSSRAARRSPTPADAGAAGPRRGSPSFDVEERGSDGAVSRGCCGPHSRRGADPCADWRRGARAHELGSGGLSAVASEDRRMGSMSASVIGIDVGTSGVRAAALAEAARCRFGRRRDDGFRRSGRSRDMVELRSRRHL